MNPRKAAAKYGPDSKYYRKRLKGPDGKTVGLAAGDYVVIDSAPAIFAPYAGKPSLGFK